MYHKSNLGSYGEGIPCDMDGYVPEADDGPWALAVDHTESTHEADGTLTEYGRWWEDEGYPEWRDAAIAATESAEEALSEWQSE